ncbi:MAG: hypothetical protein ACHRXM_04660 [Isosphaerales bacterium]
MKSVTYCEFAVVRYNTDGSLDTTFNKTGKEATPIGSSTKQAFAYALAFETVSGVAKIVVVGSVANGSATQTDFAVVRYNLDGSLDTSFGGGTGEVTTDFQTRSDVATGVVIQSDGKIVVAGLAEDHSSDQYAGLARYNTDGSLDTSFGGGTGKELLTNTPRATGVALETNGKIDLVGTVANEEIVGGKIIDLGSKFEVSQFNTDGSVDTTFGTDGVADVDLGGSDHAYAIAVQSNPNLPNYGDIMAAGCTTAGVVNYQIGVIALTSAGVLDPAFGTGGIAITSTGLWSKGSAIAFQPGDGKVVVAGSDQDSGGIQYFVLVRYNTDGSLDTTF